MVENYGGSITRQSNLEERKIKEIEHSRIRRQILQGYERCSDTNRLEEARNLDILIRDKAAFKRHFANTKYYSITRQSEMFIDAWLRRKCSTGVKVLDFACGNGENGLMAAKYGADVTGIDISPEGIENARANAIEAGVGENCTFEVMDGENMTFDDNSFDLGIEYGALHHVDLDRAMSELSRVLRPEAQMLCVEALRHNPLIHWYRRLTPHLRTQWEYEHILGVESVEVMRKYFKQVEVNFFHLAALAAVPFRKTALFRPLRTLLDGIDRVVLQNQTLGKYAWIMIVELRRSAE